jgi:outer membrane protein OmpA-like peptidoglycan-associated protein
MSDEARPIIHSVSEAGATATHAPLLPPAALVATALTKDEHNTIKPTLVPFACWRGSDMNFKFESSFVLPGIAPQLKALKKLIDKHTLTDEQGKPKHRPALTVFGHADPTGSDDFNKALSGRRAQVIYGLLTRKTELWEELFNNHADHWDKETLGTMLDTVSSAASKQPSSPKAPQTESQPVATGQTPGAQSSAADTDREKQINKLQHDPGERKQLFKSYMDAVCVAEVFRLEAADQARLQKQGVEIAERLAGLLGQEFAEEEDFLQAVERVAGPEEKEKNKQPLLREALKTEPYAVKPEDFLAGGKDKGGKGDYQGCGEFNPSFLQSQQEVDKFKNLPNSSPEKPILKAVRDAANEQNRRVLIFLFRPGVQITPEVWPCPRAKEGTEGCRKRFFRDGDERRNSRLPEKPRSYDETNRIYACRFYDRLSNNSPCELALPEASVEIVFDDPLLGVASNIEVQLTFANGRSESVKTNGDGIITVNARPGSFVDTAYERQGIQHRGRVFLNPPDINSEAGIWQRLVNLGYARIAQPPAVPGSQLQLDMALQEFQSAFRIASRGTLDEATRHRLREAHDEDPRPWNTREWFQTPNVGPDSPQPKAQHT